MDVRLGTLVAASPGRIDLDTFGLVADDLDSLRAIAVPWSAAVEAAFSAAGDNADVAAFAGETRHLVGSLGEVAWQDRWLSGWRLLQGQGVPGSTLFAGLNLAIDLCEKSICPAGQPSRVHLELVALLRRAVMAALACAVDLGEESRLLEAGVPDELAALRYLREAAGQSRPLALLSIAVLNRDAFAHLSASELHALPALVASRIQRVVRGRDRLFTGREGEWLLALPDVHSMTQPALAGSNVQRAFAQALRLPGGKLQVFEIAIGAAMMPEHAVDAEAALAACRLARWGLLANRQSFGWFHPDIQADWNKRFELANEFKKALDNEALHYYLQPQVDAVSGRCVGAELLLRWQRASGEWVSPLRLMEIVDENGWRRLFTDWAIRAALRIASELGDHGDDFRLSLNLTADDLLDDDIVDMIVQRLETWQMGGERFTLELTESAMMQDRERALDTLLRLRDLGFRLAIDDFGTGYSSLSHLVNLPIDEIKIDRSFIVAMGRSDEYLRMVRTIVDLARDLDMTPLAEGVEEREQVEQLQRLGCQRIQGYYFARPMAAGDFVAWRAARDA